MIRWKFSCKHTIAICKGNEKKKCIVLLLCAALIVHMVGIIMCHTKRRGSSDVASAKVDFFLLKYIEERGGKRDFVVVSLRRLNKGHKKIWGNRAVRTQGVKMMSQSRVLCTL